MNREELAAQIFAVSCYKGGQPCADSFAQADKFLDYAAKQRKPKACDHPAYTYDSGVCVACGTPLLKPEPPKPERVAREVWVCFNSDGTPMYAWGTQDREGTRKLFREVLPEDGK